MIKRIIVGFLLTLTVVATSWSLFHPEFFRVHDYVHAARVGEMARALSEGHFPVRWSPNFGYGYGMPLFEFYAPLPYCVGAGLYLLGVDVVLALKVLWLICSIITLVGAYKLGSLLFGKTGGALVAVALTLAPYRAVNLYIRGSLSEAWGIMAMPWILLGIVQIVRRQRAGWLTLVLGLVTLFLSHNLTTLIFVPLSLVFGLGVWLIERQNHKRDFGALLTIGGSYGLAVGLSAFYLVPAFLEKGYTKVAGIVGGYFDYTLHFLYLRQLVTPKWGFGGSQWGPDDGISFFLGFGQLAGVLLVLMVVAWWKLKTFRQSHSLWSLINDRRLQFFSLCLGLVGVSGFMTLGKSQALWSMTSLLPFIQFPWRWLSGTIMFLALMIGSGMVFVPHRLARYVIATGLIISMLVINWWYFRPELYLDDANALYYTDGGRIQEHMSGVLNDYIPSQMPAQLTPPSQLLTTNTHQANALTVLVDRGHEKLIKTDFTQPAPVALSMADFPGWKVEIDGQPVEKQTTSVGTIGVTIPQGEHLVGVRFGHTPVRLASDVISALSLVIFLYLAMDFKNRHNQSS